MQHEEEYIIKVDCLPHTVWQRDESSRLCRHSSLENKNEES